VSSPSYGHDGFQRDRPETPFSRILSAFVLAHEGVRAAVFLDVDGECIDYAARLDPFEALVLGATLLIPTKEMLTAASSSAAGAPLLWVLEAERLDAVVRRVSDEHLLVIWLVAGGLGARILRAMGPLAELLRREAGLEAPGWDPEARPLDVETRVATGWGYAPRTLRGLSGRAEELEVLGRWTESGTLSSQQAVCFRVRLGDQELTLVHEPALERWYRR
jgi:hypothetical protein